MCTIINVRRCRGTSAHVIHAVTIALTVLTKCAAFVDGHRCCYADELRDKADYLHNFFITTN